MAAADMVPRAAAPMAAAPMAGDQRFDNGVPPSSHSLLALTQNYLTPADQHIVAQAQALAARAHAGFTRKDGRPYLDHVTAVAQQLAAWGAPAAVLAAGLLHDIGKEHYAAGLTLAEVAEILGEEVAQLVQNVSRLGRLGTPYSTEYADSTQERMAMVTSQLPWVALMLQRSPTAVVIKIADKLHNYQSLAALPQVRQLAFATSTMSIFVPFAERLGMRAVKRLLEDHAFAILQPDAFAIMQQRYHPAARQAAAGPLIDQMQQALAAQGIAVQIASKHRSLFDMYRLETAVQNAIPLHLADPIIMITPDRAACYQVLGAVHALWPPQPGQMVDYIAAPRPNGYRALHTRLHIAEQEWLVVAIRDQMMEVVADWGITAVWQGIPVQLGSTFPDWQEPPPGKIGVLTPDGDFITLPQAATPVDFAYAIHIGLGHQCMGAMVNGKQVPLDWHLESGDVVRILTGSAHVGPSPEWLSFVKTARARAAIRRWLKAEKPEDAAATGWRLLDEQLRPAGMTLSSPPVMGRLTAVAHHLGYATRDALLLAIGLGQADGPKVLRALQAVDDKTEGRPLLRATIVSVAEADMPQRLAACCRPAPPDAIVGYMTKVGVVTIHRASCYKVRRLRPLIQADWPLIDMQPHAEVHILALDRPGLVHDVSRVVAAADVTMTSFHADRIPDGSAQIRIGVGEVPRWQLDRLIMQLEGTADVRRVERRAPSLPTQMSGEVGWGQQFENPYTLRPVTGSSFYGRKRELRELIQNLRDVRPGEAVLLWGPRRIGKTSLLLELQQRIMSGQDYVLVFVDMQRLSGRSTTIFIRDILRAIAQALGQPEETPKLNRLKRDPLGYFRSFLDNNPLLRHKHLVLIIDEFQLLPHLTEEEATLADLNRTFRSLIQHRGGLTIIFSGGGVLDALLQQPEASFMLEVAHYQKMDCLEETAARQLIIEPAQHVTYAEKVVDNLLYLTAGHPYYLQWLCGELMARADREQQRVIADDHLEALLNEWLPEQGEQFFNHLWGSSAGFSRPQQFISKLVLAALATHAGVGGFLSLADVETTLQEVLVDTPQLWYVLQDLAKMDTVIVENDRYAVKMPLFQRWMRANYTVERVLKEEKRRL